MRGTENVGGIQPEEAPFCSHGALNVLHAVVTELTERTYIQLAIQHHDPIRL